MSLKKVMMSSLQILVIRLNNLISISRIFALTQKEKMKIESAMKQNLCSYQKHAFNFFFHYSFLLSEVSSL